MMGEYIVGLIGIAISVGLFLLGYRQTIGARKERIRSANEEIQKILVRRIVLEEYSLKVDDISRLIEGKARDFRVRSTDLLSEGQLLNSIFTRIVETDFIPREQREKVLNRLVPVISKAEEQPSLEEEFEEISAQPSSKRVATAAMAIMGALASIIGVLITVLPEIGGLETKFRELVPMVLVIVTASLTMIAFFITIYRVRDQQQGETSKLSSLSDYVEFERYVTKTLVKAGFVVRTAGSKDRGYDLIIERGGHRILVEIKAWKQPRPTQILSAVIDRLRESVSRENASEAILVTPIDLRMPKTIELDTRIKLMSLRDLRNYLIHTI